MKLQTTIRLQPESNQIDYSSKVLLLGSCFTENIGEKLAYFKFQNLQNPFGIIFHPLAIEKLIDRAVHNKLFSEEDIFQIEENWHCLEVHSLVKNTEKTVYLTQLNGLLEVLRNYIESTSHIILTYGTAWGYRYLKTNNTVANCHKIPQKEFIKELSTVEEIVACTNRIIAAIVSVNNKVSIITTVSPVRHLKDGFVENTRSKAHLIAAVHQVIETNNNVHYFPAFEIVMDELRDYRFYKEDLLHPNNTAVSIIWEKFSEAWIDAQTEHLQKQIAVVQAGLEHKPFNPQSKAHLQFLQELQKKIDTIKIQLPQIKF